MLSLHEWHPDFRLKPSKKALLAISVFHGLSIFGMTQVPIGFGLQWLAVVLVLLSLAHGAGSVGYGPLMFRIRALRWLASVLTWRVVISVKQQKGGAWWLGFSRVDGSAVAGDDNRAESKVNCRLLPNSVVSRHMIFLCFKPIDRRFALPIPLLIASDRISREDYRRLQVWLRWQGQAELGG